MLVVIALARFVHWFPRERCALSQEIRRRLMQIFRMKIGSAAQFRRLGTAVMIALPCVLAGHSAHATPGLDLQLLVDVSGSVDTDKYNLQKQGYVAAFQSAAVQSAILSS